MATVLIDYDFSMLTPLPGELSAESVKGRLFKVLRLSVGRAVAVDHPPQFEQ